MNRRFYPGEVDGSFGALTLLSLRRFQFAHGLEPTGRVDDVTRSKLVEVHGC